MNIFSGPLNSFLLKRIKKVHQFLDYIEMSFNIRQFQENAIVHPSVRIYSAADIQNLSKDRNRIIINSGTAIKGQLLIFAHGGRIEIGEDCYIGDDTHIWSADSIKIGNRVLISHSANIHDTNSHSVDSTLRHLHFKHIMSKGHPLTNAFDIISQPVIIEDDVWIGFNATILKGLTIGRNTIISACSVVTESMPGNVVVAGNPARIIKKI